jgi:hypothetical protein
MPMKRIVVIDFALGKAHSRNTLFPCASVQSSLAELAGAPWAACKRRWRRHPALHRSASRVGTQTAMSVAGQTRTGQENTLISGAGETNGSVGTHELEDEVEAC